MLWREGRAVIALSVNLNKVATLRNARGGSEPSVLTAVTVALDAGAPGITVHPRADERHIRRRDVIEVAELLAARRAAGHPPAEYNIEGDPRPDLLRLVHEVRPEQCTLVPVTPGEITSQAGWAEGSQASTLPQVVRDLRQAGIRVSLFIDATEAGVRLAAAVGADRVELYTEPFARAFEAGAAEAERSFGEFAAAAALAHSLGLGVNAGHDLDLDNLTLFRRLPHLDEVSIGHAIVSRAVFAGLESVVREYLQVLG